MLVEGLNCKITFLSMSVSTRENKSTVTLHDRLVHISSNLSSGLIISLTDTQPNVDYLISEIYLITFRRGGKFT